MKPSALIIGASSGIGLELARRLAARDYRLGLAARRKPLLDGLAASLPRVSCVQAMDVSRPDEALPVFESMLRALAPVDFVYLSAGVGHRNPELKWELEDETIRTNALGFAALAARAVSFFEKQGRGHLVGIGSVAAARAAGIAPAYASSKIFVSYYLEALRLRAHRSGLPIHVTEIRPGLVDTAMMKSARRFWVASPALAARQIVAAAEARQSLAYVTRRWRLFAWALKAMPHFLYKRLA